MFQRSNLVYLACSLILLQISKCHAGELREKLMPFMETTCMGCHDAATETGLNLTEIGLDLDEPTAFSSWVQVYDRIQQQEMPPASEPQPAEADRLEVLALLKEHLTEVNLRKQQRDGRVPSRRLSRQEYEHTLHDLLGIGGDIAKHLPPENESGTFDVVAASQDMSSVHIQAFLRTADVALDEAIQLGGKPNSRERLVNYFNSPYIQMWVDREVRRGGGTIFKTEQDVVTFRGENFVFRSDATGYKPPLAGWYRIKITAAAYQPRSSITVSLKLQNDEQGESGLLGAWDLEGEDYREVELTTYLRPNDYFYVSADELEPAPDGGIIYNSQPASEFRGEGVKIRRVSIEGPLETDWPPTRTQELFPTLEWENRNWLHRLQGNADHYRPKLVDSADTYMRRMITGLALKAYGTKLEKANVDALLDLVPASVEAEEDFVKAARIPLKAMLVSPQLLFMAGDGGSLDDYSLARRLSYFLWRSLPDKELYRLAAEGKLTESATLATQVERMLADPKSERFINEFLDQWLELDRIDATSPDTFLYPEYDDVLRLAMLEETRQFFSYLVEEDLSAKNLIDSEFTFLNRRLAEHYGIEGVRGEVMRKVALGPNSVRGGILTHASIAKITANGTVTSPVKRGSFVLANLLGRPPSPPPPNIGSIEPDTRGATTIRETLEKHQAIETCAQCHRHIDPPGFALECFDPIGIYRQRYRNSIGIQREVSPGLRLLRKEYALGHPVDTAGTMPDGFTFNGIDQYKKRLMLSKEQVARNLLSQLIAFATGGEIEFADREVVERILSETREPDFPVRTLIHKLVQSRLFTER